MPFPAYSSRAARRLVLLSLALSCLAAPQAIFGKKELTTLRVVVEGPEGEPVPRASVIVSRLKNEKSEKKKGPSLQLRTSLEGSAPLPPLEQGFYVLQVISKGYQTYGEKIELSEQEQTVTVRLKFPQDQFSVHTGDR